MKTLTKETMDELLIAMDMYKKIASELIEKLISETEQPEINEIVKGHYYSYSAWIKFQRAFACG